MGILVRQTADYGHLKGTVPDPHCGAVFLSRGTSGDPVPLTNPMVHPQFGVFYAAPRISFLFSDRILADMFINKKVSHDGILFLWYDVGGI